MVSQHSGADQRGAPGLSRHVVYWCFYDWGTSAFPAIVLSFVFAPYFLNHVAGDAVSGEALWGYAISASAIVIALLSPVFGAIADRSGRRRLWLAGCSLTAIAFSAALWWVAPEPQSVVLSLLCVAIANAAFELAYVFYNALLPMIAPSGSLGRISGYGWAAGYGGSLASLGVAYVLLIAPAQPVFGMEEPLRLAGPLAAIWFLIFAAPLVLFGTRERASPDPADAVVREGLRDLWWTIRSLRRTPSLAWFLAAHMVFIDGVNTLFILGPLIAVSEFGLSERDMLAFGMMIYVAAGLGSVVFGWLDDRVGPKRVVLISVLSLAAIAFCIGFGADEHSFWVFAAALGVFFGPVQASSRTLMARLTPVEQRAKLFGLYALAGRATAPLGPFLAASMIAITGNGLSGLAVVIALLLVGAAMLLQVREP